MPKGTPKVNCRRRALTAAPLGETGESRLDGLTVLETAKTANQQKSKPKWLKKHENPLNWDPKSVQNL